MHVWSRLDEWVAIADDLSNDFASAAHFLREARLSRHPDKTFRSALKYLENACSTFNALVDDMRGTQPSNTDPLVMALWIAHQEIERLHEIVQPDEPNAVLPQIRRLLTQASAAK